MAFPRLPRGFSSATNAEAAILSCSSDTAVDSTSRIPQCDSYFLSAPASPKHVKSVLTTDGPNIQVPRTPSLQGSSPLSRDIAPSSLLDPQIPSPQRYSEDSNTTAEVEIQIESDDILCPSLAMGIQSPFESDQAFPEQGRWFFQLFGNEIIIDSYLRGAVLFKGLQTVLGQYFNVEVEVKTCAVLDEYAVEQLDNSEYMVFGHASRKFLSAGLVPGDHATIIAFPR
ncbi:hypothetical protein P171DRAFT_486344 [Karstenula rhodostoma CBS 690.94]|uniref:Uncharacterized protein n=1 Tax=Karstenula rhodostoma CBS 690.94 TaxID=1392251 RepID=A0A9P4PEL6_9PLEO|nr:hypothetical protein P171DRAFT_486344 [Karstenula rhodostoma CBS 690.94]